MTDEFNQPPFNKGLLSPEISTGEVCDWKTLADKRGVELKGFYNQLLRTLANEKGILGQIFTKSQNKIQDPAKTLKSYQYN